MFRPMRRKRQELSLVESIEILNRETSGVLAVSGEEGYPYAVPLSYVYLDGKIFIHSAKSGHKVEAIRKKPKLSFCVVGKDEVKGEEYTTYYKSVVAFGQGRILDEKEEIVSALMALGNKYNPGKEEDTKQYVGKELPATLVVEITIEHVTGKQTSEFL